MVTATINDMAEEEAVEEAKEVGASWVEHFARFGYAVKGVAYAVVGVLAGQAALGVRRASDGTEGALLEIMLQPFGQILLSIMIVGLVGYMLWRFVQATLDPGNKGTDLMGLAQRAGYVASGIAYGGLAFSAAQLIAGNYRGGGPEDWTARLLVQPYGPWLVGLVGAGVIGIGLSYVYRGGVADFPHRFKQTEMGETEQRWATHIGRFGLVSRGLVYAVLGVLVITAAFEFDPEEVGGVGAALRALAEQPYGPWALGIMALGLIAYGAYSGIMAWYRGIGID